MKLAFVQRRFTSVGGAELYLQRLIAGLQAAKHDLHLITEKWDSASEAALKIHPIKTSRSRARSVQEFADGVRDLLAREKFDCVLSYERTHGADIFRAGGGVHKIFLERRAQFAPWWRRFLVGRGQFHANVLQLERETLDPKNTRYIVANSEMVRQEIIEHFRFPAERIFLVRNGIDVQRFQKGDRAATRARFGVKESDYLLLFVGSGWERKGLQFLLRAMRQVSDPNLKLLVVGKGRKPLSVPRNVIFAGKMKEVENAYAAADLLTFLPTYEPSANVIYESLVAGTPVVTSIYNGASEIVQPGVSGTILQNPADTQALLKAIQFWRSQPKKPISLDLQQLSIERNAAETLRILERVAEEKRNPA